MARFGPSPTSREGDSAISCDCTITSDGPSKTRCPSMLSSIGSRASVRSRIGGYIDVNMGMEMCLAVEAVHATAILDWLQDRGTGAQRVGSVSEGERVVQHILEAVRYESY